MIQIEILYYLSAGSIFRMEVVSRYHRAIVRAFQKRGILHKRVQTSLCRQLSYFTSFIDYWRDNPEWSTDIAVAGSSPLQGIEGEDWAEDGADCDLWSRTLKSAETIRTWLRERDISDGGNGGGDDRFHDMHDYGDTSAAYTYRSTRPTDVVLQVIGVTDNSFARDSHMDTIAPNNNNNNNNNNKDTKWTDVPFVQTTNSDEKKKRTQRRSVRRVGGGSFRLGMVSMCVDPAKVGHQRKGGDSGPRRCVSTCLRST